MCIFHQISVTPSRRHTAAIVQLYDPCDMIIVYLLVQCQESVLLYIHIESISVLLYMNGCIKKQTKNSFHMKVQIYSFVKKEFFI